MQRSLGCNGCNTSSITTTTTTLTSDTIFHSNNTNNNVPNVRNEVRSATKVANELRQRLRLHQRHQQQQRLQKGQQQQSTDKATTTTSIESFCNHNTRGEHSHGNDQNQLFVDTSNSTEYNGSAVEPISATPSPQPTTPTTTTTATASTEAQDSTSLNKAVPLWSNELSKCALTGTLKNCDKDTNLAVNQLAPNCKDYFTDISERKKILTLSLKTCTDKICCAGMSKSSKCSTGERQYTPITSISTTATTTFFTPSDKFKQKTTSSPSTNKSKLSMNADLLQWQDMPQHLQFNPYVLRGYRPLQTFRGCLFSLFYWHNETINILTHAIPIFYILAIVPGLMPWDKGYRFLSFCHLFGSVAPWCGSFVYHLFMNIEKGENVYYTLLKLDMVGIWVSQSFGAMPLVTATTLCFSTKWKWLVIISYCLLSFWGLYKALTASSPWQRRLCFALPFAMRSILTLLRTLGLVGGNRVSLSHVYLQVEVDGVSILGGAIGAMRIPEKWFPGLVDFYLNSHNIMHVLVVVAVYSMHKATMKDLEWMSTANCDAFTNGTDYVMDNILPAINLEL